MVWVVDFGPESVRVLAGEVKTEGVPRLAGAGKARTRGLEHGEPVHAGDMTEGLVAALREAEKTSGLKCGRIYFNFDDTALESRFPIGSRTLAGEGEIRRADVEEVLHTAERFVGHFEKSIVYSRDLHYLIDGKDSVVNPVGVFGRHLDVRLHVLLARAEIMETWQKVIERARLKKGIPVLSLLSSIYGVLETRAPEGGHVVCDLGADVLSAALFRNGAIRRYAGCSAKGLSMADTAAWVKRVTDEMMKEHPPADDLILTGDLAEKETLTHAVMSASPVASRVAAPVGLVGYDHTGDSAIVGCLRLAAKTPLARGRVPGTRHDLVADLRKRATGLIREYF